MIKEKFQKKDSKEKGTWRSSLNGKLIRRRQTKRGDGRKQTRIRQKKKLKDDAERMKRRRKIRGTETS